MRRETRIAAPLTNFHPFFFGASIFWASTVIGSSGKFMAFLVDKYLVRLAPIKYSKVAFWARGEAVRSGRCAVLDSDAMRISTQFSKHTTYTSVNHDVSRPLFALRVFCDRWLRSPATDRATSRTKTSLTPLMPWSTRSSNSRDMT